MELLRSIQTGDIAQRMLVRKGIECLAGCCQVMRQHLAKAPMQGVLFHHE